MPQAAPALGNYARVTPRGCSGGHRLAAYSASGRLASVQEVVTLASAPARD